MGKMQFRYVRRGITYALQDKKSFLIVADTKKVVILGYDLVKDWSKQGGEVPGQD
jgi:hypothetical protein